MGTAISRLQSLLEEYRNPHYECPDGRSFECGSILYGALTKEMEFQGLLPVPIAPFSGLSMSKLYKKLQSIRSPLWTYPGKKLRHTCNLGARVMAIANPVMRLANGPGLDDFRSD
jgi:hypothetical protein